MRSTSEVLAHHLKCFAERDIDGTIADYSTDAVFLSAEGAVRGRDAIRAVFEKLFNEFGKPGASITSKQRLIAGEFVYLLWTAETPDNAYELGSDTFVIRNGSIELQTFTAKTRPNH
jgi:ketosteroid isomerase-like protein